MHSSHTVLLLTCLHGLEMFSAYKMMILGSTFFVKNIFRYRHPVAINVKTGMPPFGILANHKIKMCHNSMKKIMIQKITQYNWNF